MPFCTLDIALNHNIYSDCFLVANDCSVFKGLCVVTVCRASLHSAAVQVRGIRGRESAAVSVQMNIPVLINSELKCREIESDYCQSKYS